MVCMFVFLLSSQFQSPFSSSDLDELSGHKIIVFEILSNTNLATC